MAKSEAQQEGPSSVVVAARVAPHERRLAKIATDVVGEVSLSAFARGAIRERAIRVMAETGGAGGDR